jgi:hypothetical protein
MPTAPAPTAVRQDKYSFDRETVGGITLITMHGTLNETFEGRKLAASIKSKKVLVSMFDVRRFASWGMSEWMDFVRVTSDCDLYLVECSTYSVSQLNLVTGLLGHAKLVSFYASYRCGTCSEEMQTLFLIPRDRALIPGIPGSHQECKTCGGRARLEEYPAAFFDTIAVRPAFDIDDEALAYMRTRLNYDLSPDLTRFRAFRRIQKSYTYIRLTGNIATLPAEPLARASENTTVLDLEGIVYEPNQLNAWRTYLGSALPKVKSLQLVGAPPEFLESALRPDDFRDKLKVRTFLVNYECGTCETMTTHVVDVALNLETLVTGVVPAVRCPSCRSTLTAIDDEDRAIILRALPARERDAALDNFLVKMRAESADKLENCLTPAAIAAPAAPAKRRTALYAAGALGVVVIATVGAVSYKVFVKDTPTTPPVTVIAPTPPPKPTFQRPEWIISDVPASGYCHDMINRLMCVGVSSYRTTREDGVVEATDAALEELVSSVGLKITEPTFRDTIVPGYSNVRTKALSALEVAGMNRTTDAKGAAAYTAADDVVRKARRRVVEVLQATGGAAVPAQRSDWYWEEYAGENSTATEFLVFVRFDVSLDAVRTLVDKYSVTTSVLGANAMTAFPSLAWQHESFKGGAVLTKVDDRLGHLGIKPQTIVTAVGDQPVTDASGFAHRVEDAKGELKLTVASDNTAKVIAVRP